MRAARQKVLAFVLAVCCALTAALPLASAAGASEVWVNGIKLDAASPYWKNGDVPASASDWNAHFSAATSTLTLKDAVITNSYAFSGQALIYAEGDLNLVLTGTNSVSRTETVQPMLFGIYATNALTVSGDGSLDIQLSDTLSTGTVYGIYAGDSLAVNSGSLGVNLEGVIVYGLASPWGILIAGGETDVRANGSEQSILLLSEYASFRMVGGRITGTAVSSGTVAGLVSMGTVLAGGEGYFRAQSSSFAIGLFNAGPVLSVSGGSFVFAGDSGAVAIVLPPGDVVDMRLTNVKTYASDAVNGIGKRLWTSDADGYLVGIVGRPSPFLYVEFIGSADPGNVAPQTGDPAVPLLWAGLALCALFCAAGLAAATLKKRRAAVRR